MTKDLSEGVVLDLDMETLEDYSGNGNNGVANGTTLTFDKDGRYNKARSFNGTTSDYIDLPYNSSITSPIIGTIRIKFYINSLGSTGFIYSIGRNEYSGDISGEIRLGIYCNTSSKLIINLRDSGLNTSYPFHSWILESDATLTTGTWYDLFLTFDTSPIAYLYNNNDLVTTFSFTNSTDTSDWINDLTTINYFTLGMAMYNAGGVDAFDGKISKFTQWGRSLSEKETLQLHNDISHNYQGLFDGLVLGMDFKGDVKDFSGNGNDGSFMSSIATNTTNHLGIVNTAMNFNGTSDKGTVPSTSDLSGASGKSMTYVAVIKPETLGRRIYSKGDNGSSGPYIDYELSTGSDGSVWWRFPNSARSGYAVYTTDSGVVSLNEWAVIVVSYTYGNASSMNVVVNGQHVNGSWTSGTGNEDPYIASKTLYFGGWYYYNDPNNSTTFFDGDISTILIYKRLMSVDEMISLSDLLSKGKLYPYPKQVTEGVTE